MKTDNHIILDDWTTVGELRARARAVTSPKMDLRGLIRLNEQLAKIKDTPFVSLLSGPARVPVSVPKGHDTSRRIPPHPARPVKREKRAKLLARFKKPS